MKKMFRSPSQAFAKLIIIPSHYKTGMTNIPLVAINLYKFTATYPIKLLSIASQPITHPFSSHSYPTPGPVSSAHDSMHTSVYYSSRMAPYLQMRRYPTSEDLPADPEWLCPDVEISDEWGAVLTAVANCVSTYSTQGPSDKRVARQFHLRYLPDAHSLLAAGTLLTS